MKAVIGTNPRQPHVAVAKAMFFAIPLVIGLLAGLLFDPATSPEQFPLLALLFFVVSLASYHLVASNRPLLYEVTVYPDRLELKAPFWGKQITYQLNQIDGFKKQLVHSGSGAHLHLLLYAEGKKIAEVSSLYVSNLGEMETTLETQLTFLGTEPFFFFKHTWNRLLWR